VVLLGALPAVVAWPRGAVAVNFYSNISKDKYDGPLGACDVWPGRAGAHTGRQVRSPDTLYSAGCLVPACVLPALPGCSLISVDHVGGPCDQADNAGVCLYTLAATGLDGSEFSGY
jgi:hypothetical protein